MQIILAMVKCKPKDTINRTILREHKMSDLTDAVFVPGIKSGILNITYLHAVCQNRLYDQVRDLSTWGEL